MSQNATANKPEVTARISAEALLFQQAPQSPQQSQNSYSAVIEPELFWPLDGDSEILAKGFYRYDANSVSRTHGDIRELMYYHYADDWEIKAGIGKVFWGTTESRHLVDTINQIDLIESLDDEQRLGQWMLQNKWIKNWGTLELYLLPHFRAQDFGQADLRPSYGTVIEPLYQSSDKQQHIDFAARWSNYYDNLDLGISYFDGTQRTPILNPLLVGGQPALQPVYVQTQQLGIDSQYIAGDWLLKFEGLYRQSYQYSNANGFTNYDSKAMVAGFEYSWIGINQQAHDLGIIGEYLFDEWDSLTPFQRDWMTGLRWVWNDNYGTEILLGHVVDLEDQSQLWQLEASRRLNNSWSLDITARWLGQLDNNNRPLQILKNHNQLSLKLNYFY